MPKNAGVVMPGTTQINDRQVVRLSINLAPDVAAALKKWAGAKGLSITEGVRRAIAVWDFVESERQAGNRLAVIENDGSGDRIREVILV